MHFGGLILCGGKSSRMGRDKATLPFGPELMLQRVTRLLLEAVEPVVIVASPKQMLPSLPAGLVIAYDEREGRGPLEGLQAGLAAIEGRADAVYATSRDVPLLVPAFVRRMIEMLGEHEIAVPVETTPQAPFHHPLAAVYRMSVRDRIARLLAADRLRPTFLFDEADTLLVNIEELRSVDPELQTLANLNQPADYLAALAKAGLEPQT